MLKLEGCRNVEHMRNRQEWERAREIAFTVAQFSGNIKKGVSKYQFMPFTWDENRPSGSQIANLTGEERKEAARRLIEERQRHLNEFLNKRKN